MSADTVTGCRSTISLSSLPLPSQTPHVTVCYLDKQSQFSLNEISKLIESSAIILSKSNLKVGGFNYFTKENPEVLFLDIDYPASLTNFNIKTSKLLMEYCASDNKLPFSPHMTAGRIKSKQAKESFNENKEKLSSRLNMINWNFKVNEIVLYGVDSTKSPEYQEKLIKISVG